MKARIKLWWNKIIDAMTRLENKDWEPTDIYIDIAIMEDLYEEFGEDFFQKGRFNLTHICGMKIHHEKNIQKYRITSQKMSNWEYYNGTKEPIL